MKLKFNQLPFTPEPEQVIYFESEYDEKINKFIRNNYESLKKEFAEQGLMFCYLPLLAEEAIRYNAPYVSEKNLKKAIVHIPSLAMYAVNRTPPSLLFSTDMPVTDENGHVMLQYVPIRAKWYKSTHSAFIGLINEIKKCHPVSRNQKGNNEHLGRVCEESDIRFSIKSDSDNGITFYNNADNKRCLEKADDNFDFEMTKIVEEIKQKITLLRNKGVNTIFLHNIIDEGEKLSRIKITKDHKIFLVDYNNIEIKMTPLNKAIFILFLRHQEGIRFKALSDYSLELGEIYEKISPNSMDERQKESIRRVTDPFDNSINEKCARIREAFIGCIDERLASHYFVTGKRGEPKRITLDRSMVLWE